MRKFIILLSVLFALISSCNDKSMKADVKIKIDSISRSPKDTIKEPPIPTGLKVSAYLVYNDGTVSSFDILNNKSIALWNVVAAGGDAKKPSEKTKLLLSGKFDSLSVTVKNGKKIALKKDNVHFWGEVEYEIDNTGCEDVIVDIKRNGKVAYHDTIPFRCGE